MIFPLVIIDLLFWTCRALFSMEPAAFMMQVRMSALGDQRLHL